MRSAHCALSYVKGAIRGKLAETAFARSGDSSDVKVGVDRTRKLHVQLKSSQQFLSRGRVSFIPGRRYPNFKELLRDIDVAILSIETDSGVFEHYLLDSLDPTLKGLEWLCKERIQLPAGSFRSIFAAYQRADVASALRASMAARGCAYWW